MRCNVAVAGVMIQAIYLGGVWVSIRMGLSAGVAALIVNLQPVLTICLWRTGRGASQRAADRRCCRGFLWA